MARKVNLLIVKAKVTICSDCLSGRQPIFSQERVELKFCVVFDTCKDIWHQTWYLYLHKDSQERKGKKFGSQLHLKFKLTSEPPSLNMLKRAWIYPSNHTLNFCSASCPHRSMVIAR